MSVPKQRLGPATFSVENIGGISETEVELDPGVTVLTGDNATNRTSFMQAIMAAMGSDQASLKADTDRGSVEFDFNNQTYERTLERAGNSVHFDGEGYLDDPVVADLFAFLHEGNEARRAVARSDDLRELIMRPIDVEEIKREIERLNDEKASINDELATIESRKQELPDLEQRRNAIEDDIDTTREELAEIEAEIDDHNNDIEQSRQVKDELEDSLAELRSVRSDLEGVRRDIETQEQSIDSLQSEQAELEEELAELSPVESDEEQHLEERIEELRQRRQGLNAEISDLQSLISYNREQLEEGNYELFEAPADSNADAAVTDQLLPDSEEEVVCWTCGSSVERSQIESTIERLEDLREQKVQTLNSVKSDLEDHKSDRREIERTRQRREELERKIDNVDAEIERRKSRVETLEENRSELSEEIETLEEEVDEYEDAEFEEILTLHREANELEFEIEQLESELSDVEAEIEAIEERVEEAEGLREKRETILDELEDTRTKIDQIEANAIEEFNEHMDAILDVLEYENLDRIWIERITENVREGRQTVERSAFELHVVRTTENGVAYEDTIDHLSESEREVTGLVFALAGYLVHDLYEEVPFMLLDSLEAIDSDRIAKLVEYFADYASFLVVALLPEDAQAVDDDYARITSI